MFTTPAQHLCLDDGQSLTVLSTDIVKYSADLMPFPDLKHLTARYVKCGEKKKKKKKKCGRKSK